MNSSNDQQVPSMQILREALMDTLMMFDIDNDEDLYMLPVEQFDEIVTYLAAEIVTRSQQS